MGLRLSERDVGGGRSLGFGALPGKGLKSLEI